MVLVTWLLTVLGWVIWIYCSFKYLITFKVPKTLHRSLHRDDFAILSILFYRKSIQQKILSIYNIWSEFSYPLSDYSNKHVFLQFLIIKLSSKSKLSCKLFNNWISNLVTLPLNVNTLYFFNNNVINLKIYWTLFIKIIEYLNFLMYIFYIFLYSDSISII